MSSSKILIVFFIAVIISSCQLFGSDNVKVIVPNHLDTEYWALSPKGDKLVYNPNNDDGVLLFPQTGEEHKFECALMWLDNETLLCIQGKKSVITIEGFEEISLEDIEATTVEVRSLLSRAEKIYYLEETNALYLLSRDVGANLVKGYAINNLENPAEVLEGVDYISVPPDRPQGIPERQILSPNQKYYYNMPGESLTIYKTENDEKVAEFKTESPYFLAAEGWASDSSGVYFHIYGVAFASATAPKGIRKLEVPN